MAAKKKTGSTKTKKTTKPKKAKKAAKRAAGKGRKRAAKTAAGARPKRKKATKAPPTVSPEPVAVAGIRALRARVEAAGAAAGKGRKRRDPRRQALVEALGRLERDYASLPGQRG